MKITVLSENTTARDDIFSEHGLSLFIEVQGLRLVFDMGQGELYYRNAKKLGIDIESADAAVISHGHYDHGGGLSHFLSINKKAPVYIKQGAFGEFYNGQDKYIGLDSALCENSRLIYTDKAFQICEGITLYPAECVSQESFLGHFGLTTVEKSKKIPDSFLHEQYLLIEENGQRILISGCSHRGIIDIARTFSPDVLVGGFHTSKITDESALSDIAKKLSPCKTKYYTCHCTGKEQFDILKKHLSDIHYISAGHTIEI